MAKAILEFNLDSPDDSRAHLRAVKSLDLTLALYEIMYNTKKGIENEIELDELLDLSQYDLLDHVYKRLWEILNDHGINLDEL